MKTSQKLSNVDEPIPNETIKQEEEWLPDNSQESDMQFEDEMLPQQLVRKEKRKTSRKNKSSAGTRKVRYPWRNSDVVLLISTVEQYRGLWDVGSAEYKLPKIDQWRSVTNDLGIDGVDVNEAKAKWSALRTCFMFNLAKLRKNQLRQGLNASNTVSWKYFGRMMFLEAGSVQQSTSMLEMQSAVSDRANVVQNCSSSQLSTSQATVIIKRQPSETSTSSPSTSPFTVSTSGQARTILNSAGAALNSGDCNSAFCDYLLAELRTFPEAKARILRHNLARTMIDFMEECHSQAPQSSPQIARHDRA